MYFMRCLNIVGTDLHGGDPELGRRLCRNWWASAGSQPYSTRRFGELRVMRRTPQEKKEVWFHNVEHVFVPLDHWGGLDRLRKLRHLAERFDDTRSYWAFVCADPPYAPHDV